MKIFLLFFVWIFILSCTKGDPSPSIGPRVKPFNLVFKFIKNKEKLPDSILNNIKLSYYLNNIKQYQSIYPAADTFSKLGIQTTDIDFGFISADDGVKNYYFEFPDGSKDTLYADYRRNTEAQAFSDTCFCYIPLKHIYINGKIPNIDSSLMMYGTVYLFNK